MFVGLISHFSILTKCCFKEKVCQVKVKTPFPRLAYDEAMNRYGSDKPDLRFGMELKDLTEVLSFLNSITEGKKPQTKRIRFSHLTAFFNFRVPKIANLKPKIANNFRMSIFKFFF